MVKSDVVMVQSHLEPKTWLEQDWDQTGNRLGADKDQIDIIVVLSGILSHIIQLLGWKRALSLGPVRICRLLLEHIPGWPNYDQEWSIVHMWSSGLWFMMFESKREEYFLQMLAELDQIFIDRWKELNDNWDLLGVSLYIVLWCGHSKSEICNHLWCHNSTSHI